WPGCGRSSASRWSTPASGSARTTSATRTTCWRPEPGCSLTAWAARCSRPCSGGGSGRRPFPRAETGGGAGRAEGAAAGRRLGLAAGVLRQVALLDQGRAARVQPETGEAVAVDAAVPEVRPAAGADLDPGPVVADDQALLEPPQSAAPDQDAGVVGLAGDQAAAQDRVGAPGQHHPRAAVADHLAPLHQPHP